MISIWIMFSRMFLIGLLVLAPAVLNAKESWRKISLIINGKPLNHMMAIGVSGIATIGNEKTQAFLVFYGKKGSKNINMGVIINNATQLILERDIDAYRGPDLSDTAIKNDAFEIKISQKMTQYSFSTRMVIESTKLFPTDVSGGADEFFATNLRSTEPERKAFLKFIDSLCKDFDDGNIVIGRGSFSNVVLVNFNNSCAAQLVADLKTFVFPK